MQPEIDYEKIGRRIKTLRSEKGLSQSDLGALAGCSNNHVSHVETGQTKISLSMLLKISRALGKDMDYFLMDTPYVSRTKIQNTEIAEKLQRCNAQTLVAASKMLDILIEQQDQFLSSQS